MRTTPSLRGGLNGCLFLRSYGHGGDNGCKLVVAMAKRKKPSSSPSSSTSQQSDPSPPRITSNVKQNLQFLRLWKEFQKRKSGTPRPSTSYRRKRVEKEELPEDVELYEDPTLALYYTHQGLETAAPVLLVDGYNVVALREDGCPKVWVVTSDHNEQHAAYGAGAFVWSSKALVSEIRASQKEVEQMLQEHRSSSFRGKLLKDNLDSEVVDALKDLRNKLSQSEQYSRR